MRTTAGTPAVRSDQRTLPERGFPLFRRALRKSTASQTARSPPKTQHQWRWVARCMGSVVIGLSGTMTRV